MQLFAKLKKNADLYSVYEEVSLSCHILMLTPYIDLLKGKI